MHGFRRFLAVVGYFRSSGYFKLRQEFGDVSDIRILIGINADDIFRNHNLGWEMLQAPEKAKELKIKPQGSPIVYRFAGGRYFKVITNYSVGSSAERIIFFDSKEADAVGAVLSSNLSFWFYQIYSDNLNWKSYEIENFPIPNFTDQQLIELKNLYSEYLEDIEKNANIRVTSGKSSYNVSAFKEYKIGRSKSIVDKIDDYIGPIYGLTSVEIEFIKNYEIEFRLSEDE